MNKLKEYFKIKDTIFQILFFNYIIRQNYKYYMIDRALEIKAFLMYLVSNLLSLTNNQLNKEKWIILIDLANLLKSFTIITKIISAFNYLTIGEIKQFFLAIKVYLEKLCINYQL